MESKGGFDESNPYEQIKPLHIKGGFDKSNPYE
jgi:hypothetical protein